MPFRLRFVQRRHDSRWTIAILSIAAILQAIFLFSCYAPAHGGTDQNGYHVTARPLSDGNGASFVPKSSFTFVGNMMVLLANGRVYAKYPPGYPLLAAAARLLGGATAVYWVNPICTTLACSLSFFLFRTLLDRFSSILAVFWLSWNPVVLNYGRVNSRPFTIDDAGDIMSATKPLAGALMMEVLDKGQVQIDEPIDKIFSSFRGIPVKRQMTIRDLFDHLNGLTGDWGDQIHDTEEIVAGYYSAVDVGNYSYNELGFALGGKIIEAVTGEAFPQFARHHLLEPLGMDHTTVTNGGGHNATTPLDYAKFGQLLLNRGSYGSMRFFSEKTFQQMLPATDGSNRRGMGLIWMPWQRFGFAPGTFGHTAGNSSVLAIDPIHDLVVVIVSGGVRKDFQSRAAPFFQAVIDSLL